MTEPSAASPAAQPEPGPGAATSHHHYLVQAPVAAVDADGLRVVSIGTVAFAVASVVLALLRPQLAADGRSWWLAVTVSGFLLGLVGLLYCWNRVRDRGRTAPGSPPRP